MISDTMEAYIPQTLTTIEETLAIDRWAREKATKLVNSFIK